MSVINEETFKINRGMALHKMIRLITIAMGGEAYLNFMGNEFGHPEWIDFPREGNGWSYQHSRRQFNLATDKNLRYHQLYNFDKAMIHCESEYNWLLNTSNYCILSHEGDKIIAYERGELMFLFNFHSTNSYEHYKIGTHHFNKFKVVLDTDKVAPEIIKQEFGGHARVDPAYNLDIPIHEGNWNNAPRHFQIYLPSRCAIVLKAKN